MTLPRRFAILFLPALLAAGCGQKGPLYLPQDQPFPREARAPKKKLAPKPNQTAVPQEVPEDNVEE